VNGFQSISRLPASAGLESSALTLAPEGDQETAVEVPLPGPGFTLEISLCSPAPAGGEWGLALSGVNQEPLRFTFHWENSTTELTIQKHDRELLRSSLAGLRPQAYHLLRLERENDSLCLSIDDDLLQDSARLRWTGQLEAEFDRIRLFTRLVPAKFAGLQIS
jgi:hypothetical protein